MNFTKLIWAEPWLAPVILNLENVIETNQIDTAGVTPNGKVIYFNPAFYDSLSADEQLGLMLHEILHIVDLHSMRRSQRQHKKWNIACDMAINYKITDSGYVLPKGGYAGVNDSAENIYDTLKDIKEQFKFFDLLEVNMDGTHTYADEETLEAIESAFQMSYKGSTLLSKKFFPAKAKASWESILQSYVKSAIGADHDYIDYEFDEFGICEDILTPKPMSKICALIDESESIEDDLYCAFLGELEKLQRYAQVFASGFSDGTSLNAVPLKLYFRTMTGGTNVLPAYEEACRKGYDLIIVLTDGYLAFPAMETGPTIWVMKKGWGRKREVLV